MESKNSQRMIGEAIRKIALGRSIERVNMSNSGLKKERDRHQQNSDALLSEMKQWQVDSTTMATDVKALRLTVDEMERYRADDLAKIEQMGVNIKNLEATAKHQLEVNVPIATTLT